MKSGTRKTQLAWAAAAGLAGFMLFAGCKPKESAYKASEAVSAYAKDMSDSAGRLTSKAGEKLGLVDKKWDYVRLAWNIEEETAAGTAVGFDAERELGRALFAEFIARHGQLADERMDRYLNLLAAGVAAHGSRPGLPVCVAVLQSEDRLAWGLPGGYLVVTLGALRCCESESEAAGVLASALAQSNLRFVLALAAQEQAALGAAATGKPAAQLDAALFSKVVQVTATKLLQQGPSNLEWRAGDRTATAMLVRMGYEPGGLKAWLARVQVKLLEESGGRPLKDRATFRLREDAIAERLEELHAPAIGRTISDRWKREVKTRLPAPRL